MGNFAGQQKQPSGLGTFVATVLFALVVGLVGPIFLIVWFTMDQSGPTWLLLVGMGITIAALVIGALVGATRVKNVRKRARILAMGVRGSAEIVGAEDTHMTVNERQVIKLTLNVTAVGVAPFSVVKKIPVSPLHYAGLAGRVVPVLVDPATGDVELLWDEVSGGTTTAYPPFSGGRI